MAPLLIVGSGLAGITLAREFRKLDKQAPLALITSDDGAYYSKPTLTNALCYGKGTAQLVIAPREYLAAQLGAEILAHTLVGRILPDEHALETSAGRLGYRKLVLAVGAHPIRLPLQGDGVTDVLSVNNLAGYARFRERLNTAGGKVAILGAGLIGCEFANDLRSIGIETSLFDLAPQPLGRLLPPQAAAYYRVKLEANGIVFFCDTCIVRITREKQGYRLSDNHGAEYCADIVLSAVGLNPATELAQGAGLKIQRGIVVDKRLCTSDPDIFALGDCAEVSGLVLPYVMPIMQAAAPLAKILASASNGTAEVTYPAMPVVVKTPACPAVVCLPPLGVEGIWRETVNGTGVRAVFENAAGKPIGFALIGDAIREKQALAAQMPAWL